MNVGATQVDRRPLVGFVSSPSPCVCTEEAREWLEMVDDTDSVGDETESLRSTGFAGRISSLTEGFLSILL